METRSGHKTTEFWITVLTMVGVLAASLAGSIPARWATFALAISAGAYAIARGLAKEGIAPAEPEEPRATTLKK